jgi:hypothetical protein
MNTYFRIFQGLISGAMLSGILLATNVALAQDGPGGVGDCTGTSALKIWMDANDLDGDDDFSDNPANGTLVSTWTDKSGNSNDLTQGTSAHRPQYYVSGGQYNAVNFINDGGNTFDYMTFTNTTHLSAGTAIFVLIPSHVSGAASNSLMDDNTRSLRIEQYSDNNHVGYTRYGVADYTTNLSSNINNISIVSFRKNSNTTNMEISQNNTTQTVNVGDNTQAGIPLTNMGRYIPGSPTNNADAANYRCIEILTYNTYLSDVEIRIVENYLSAKYNSISIPNDDYTMDNPGNGDFDREVAGIGRLSTGTHDDSKSSIVEINNPKGLNNDEFIYWGHDNGLLNSSNTDVPTGIEARFMRVWGLNEIGKINKVDVTFDLTGQAPVTASDLRLLIDTDNDGIFNDANTEIVSGASQSGNNYTFTYDFAQNSSLRFTLGTVNKVQTPLPVKLVDFTATASSDGGVNLEWSTASETNNGFFTVKRSVDGHTFDDLFEVPGAGSSGIAHTYGQTDDKAPGGRVYYSLYQTDNDGAIEHLKTIAVNVPEARKTAEVYPNPAVVGQTCHVRLPGDWGTHFESSFISTSGEVTPATTVLDGRELEIQVPDHIGTGVFFLSIKAYDVQQQIKVRVLLVRP